MGFPKNEGESAAASLSWKDSLRKDAGPPRKTAAALESTSCRKVRLVPRTLSKDARDSNASTEGSLEALTYTEVKGSLTQAMKTHSKVQGNNTGMASTASPAPPVVHQLPTAPSKDARDSDMPTFPSPNTEDSFAARISPEKLQRAMQSDSEIQGNNTEVASTAISALAGVSQVPTKLSKDVRGSNVPTTPFPNTNTSSAARLSPAVQTYSQTPGNNTGMASRAKSPSPKVRKATVLSIECDSDVPTRPSPNLRGSFAAPISARGVTPSIQTYSQTLGNNTGMAISASASVRQLPPTEPSKDASDSDAPTKYAPNTRGSFAAPISPQKLPQKLSPSETYSQILGNKKEMASTATSAPRISCQGQTTPCMDARDSKLPAKPAPEFATSKLRDPSVPRRVFLDTGGTFAAPILNRGGSCAVPISPQELTQASRVYSKIEGNSKEMTSRSMSPIRFRPNAYATSQSSQLLNSTALSQSASLGSLPTMSMPAVGSQSSEFVDLEKNNKLRDQGIAKVAVLDPTEQDSDLMERMADGKYVGCKASGAVPLVSLGCSCGPKLSFKDIGRGAETLPFDWSRTRVEGLLQFISTGFAGFFDSAIHHIAYTDEGGKEWRAFRGPLHSFWHDDPFVPAMRERYTRRIKRFYEIRATNQPVLFVRSVAATSEVPRTLELLQLLKNTFGPQAKLLLIVDFQGPSAIGLVRLVGCDNLLLCSFDTHNAPSQAAPYGQIIQEALKWATGQPIQAAQLSSLQDFHARVTSNEWGMYGACRVPAFVP